MQLTPELMNKAKTAHSASELTELALENGIKLTADEAQKYFDMLHPAVGELSDDELDNVSGGGCGGGGNKDYGNSPYHIGQTVRVRDKSVSGGEWTGTIHELPVYTTVGGKSGWFYAIYVDDMPAPYSPGPTIVENVPLSNIIGEA